MFGDVRDDAVSVGRHGDAARVEELAESPLGDRLAARTEHLEPLVARVRRDDVAAQTHGDVLWLDPTLPDDAHRLTDEVEDLQSLVAPLRHGDVPVE